MPSPLRSTGTFGGGSAGGGLGLLAIVVTLFFRNGLAGWAQQRWRLELFPVQRRLTIPGDIA